MSTFTLKKPLDDETRTTFRELFEATEALGIRACLIGAQARVIWLEHVHDRSADRATSDTDFVIQIDDWTQFEVLSNHLIENCGWRKDQKQSQRFFSSVGRMVDLVPCGGVADDHQISWPPEFSHQMDVRGFELAFSEGVLFSVDDCQLTIAPLHVLVLLKIISWWDRETGQEKDAEDLVSLLSSYADTEAYDMLELHEHADLYELEDDHELRGARLGGRLIAVGAAESTLNLAIAILSDALNEEGSMKLVSQAARAIPGDFDEATDRALVLIESLQKGLRDINGRPAG